MLQQLQIPVRFYLKCLRRKNKPLLTWSLVPLDLINIQSKSKNITPDTWRSREGNSCESLLPHEKPETGFAFCFWEHWKALMLKHKWFEPRADEVLINISDLKQQEILLEATPIEVIWPHPPAFHAFLSSHRYLWWAFIWSFFRCFTDWMIHQTNISRRVVWAVAFHTARE